MLEGRANWLEWAESSGIEVIDESATVEEIDGRSDLAYLRGSYTWTYSVGGGEPVSETGKYLWILRKQSDGFWRITVGIQ